MFTMCYLLFVIRVLIAQEHWSKSPRLEELCSLKAVAFSLLLSVYCEGWDGSSVYCCYRTGFLSSGCLDIVYCCILAESVC